MPDLDHLLELVKRCRETHLNLQQCSARVILTMDYARLHEAMTARDAAHGALGAEWVAIGDVLEMLRNTLEARQTPTVTDPDPWAAPTEDAVELARLAIGDER